MSSRKSMLEFGKFVYFLLCITFLKPKLVAIILLNAVFILIDKKVSRISNTALDQIVKIFSAKKTPDLDFIATTLAYSIIDCALKSVKSWIKPFFEVYLGILIESNLFKKYITLHFAEFYESGPTVNFIRVKTQSAAIYDATSLLMFDFIYCFLTVLSSAKYLIDILEVWILCCLLIFLFFNISLEILFFLNLKKFEKTYIKVEEEKGKYLVEYFDNFFVSRLNKVDSYPGIQKFLTSDAHLKYNFFLESIKFQKSPILIAACAVLFLNSKNATLKTVSTLREFFNLTNGLSTLTDKLFLLESKRAILSSNHLEANEFKSMNAPLITDDRLITDSYLNINLINISIYLKDLEILHNINLNITSGAKIALIGENGCGKTTFLRFFLGFIKTAGRVEINGKNVSSISEKLSVSYLPQCTILNGTIYEELSVNNKSKESLLATAKTFEIHEFISSIPTGYETPTASLNERQKQLVKIAKYGSKKANLLLADEPLSYLDNEYQNKVMDILLNSTEQSIKLVIIHQSEQAYRFDKIFHFSNGTIKVMKPNEYIESISHSQKDAYF